VRWLSDRALERLRGDAEPPDLAGTPYRLREELGRGGMGVVWLADDLRLERQVALKVLAAGEAVPGAAERLLAEARIVARLEHPGIVPVHDAGTLPDGRVFYAMKLVRGPRLDEHLARLATTAERLRVFVRVCEAVAFAHAHGVIHRDLKPENVMVGEFGEVLVLDWGVAKALRGPAAAAGGAAGAAGPHATSEGTVVGTPAWMAPEQARGALEEVDERSDVFALGGILFFLLAGRVPAPGEAAPVGVPRRLRAICGKARAAAREDRYEGVAGLGADVERWLDGLPVQAYRGKVSSLPKGLLFGLVVGFLLAFVVAWLQQDHWARDPAPRQPGGPDRGLRDPEVPRPPTRGPVKRTVLSTVPARRPGRNCT
jgi:serine/threonine protein kinase